MEKARVEQNGVQWYRVYPGQLRKWIITREKTGRILCAGDMEHLLQPSIDASKNTYILILPAVSVSDTAVYHCCVQTNTCADGSQLNVTSEYTYTRATP